jgi:hypothetical protein
MDAYRHQHNRRLRASAKIKRQGTDAVGAWGGNAPFPSSISASQFFRRAARGCARCGGAYALLITPHSVVQSTAGTGDVLIQS